MAVKEIYPVFLGLGVHNMKADFIVRSSCHRQGRQYGSCLNKPDQDSFKLDALAWYLAWPTRAGGLHVD